VIIFFITALSLIADLDLIVLTLQAIGLGSGKKGVLASIGFNPADCIALALIGGAAMMGILFMEYWMPGWLPDSMTKSKTICKVLMALSAVMLVFAMIAVGQLAKVRAEASDISEAQLAEMINGGQLASDSIADSPLTKPGARTYLFIFISVLTLINSVIGVFVFPSVVMILVCLFLATLLVPIGIVSFVTNLLDRLVTLLFNFCLAILNIVQGLLNGPNKKLGPLAKVDDSLPQEQVQGNDRAQATNSAGANPSTNAAPVSGPRPASANASSVAVGSNADVGPETRDSGQQPAGAPEIDASGFNPLGV
jgi:hypothetical protein